MDNTRPSGLQKLSTSHGLAFQTPTKKIHDVDDVNFFLTSKAYTDLVTFILQLNVSLFPENSTADPSTVITWELKSNKVPHTPATQKLSSLLIALGELVTEAPPDQGPRRFGNVAFRKWYGLLEAKVDALLETHLPSLNADPHLSPKPELTSYLLGSFGSAQRLDYGTGHELSFLAFLAGIWKLGGFHSSNNEADHMQERAIVLHVFEPYVGHAQTAADL